MLGKHLALLSNSLHQHFLSPFLHLQTETQGTKSAGTVADSPGKPQVCRFLHWPHRGWRDKVISPGPVVQRTPASIPRRNKKAPPLAPKARYSILRWCTDGWKPQQWTRSSAEGRSKDSIRSFLSTASAISPCLPSQHAELVDTSLTISKKSWAFAKLSGSRKTTYIFQYKLNSYCSYNLTIW